jgi:hypothetical protein
VVIKEYGVIFDDLAKEENMELLKELSVCYVQK